MEQILNKEAIYKNRVHRVLAHSYVAYFILFLFGICFDFIFKIKIFTSSIMIPFGVLLLVFSSFLVLWAQKTSRDLNTENLSKETFLKGPYRYTRSPTHWGLFLLMLGFGVISNAIFIILFTLFSFLVAKFIFLDKEEKILAEKYGTPYLEYKKIVKF